MRIAPPFSTSAHSISARVQASRGELALRYLAAYGCTFVAILAAQLIIPNESALVLGAITLIGLPISLYLRASGMRVFGLAVPRFLINSTIVIITSALCFYMLIITQPELFSHGAYQTVMVSHSAGESIAVLMNMFLIFAAVRSLAIINDKDAVLSAVPSFSVLLLLIVVHRGVEVVAYFLAWSLISAILFALDHRLESRQQLTGVVPSLLPGQDVKLSARGLTTVMGFSLACAISISYFLSSRDPEERGVVEGWIVGLAGRMTKLALNMPDVSVNSGPERQIDYSSGPSLPTRAELWGVAAFTVDELTQERRPLRPNYWRMFTLSQYNGATWSQTAGSGQVVPLSPDLGTQGWPLSRRLGRDVGRFQSPRFLPPPDRPGQTTTRERTNGSSRTNSSSRTEGRMRVEGRRLPSSGFAPPGGLPMPPGNMPLPPGSPSLPPGAPPRMSPGTPPTIAPGGSAGVPTDGPRLYRPRPGYNVSALALGKQTKTSFGAPRKLAYLIIEPRVAHVGFAPQLPSVRAIRIRTQDDKLPPSIRTRRDGALDVGVLQTGHMAVMLSEVAPDQAYGFYAAKSTPPSWKKQKPNPRARLSAAERRENLKLPARLTAANSRVLLLARKTLRAASSQESNYRLARRLAVAVRNGAVYTLRPPVIPENADAAEYFLFESRRGYCTYFAGALTVLCRAAGIPARVVSGFADPEWAGGGEIGVLREANAHAWTEVWVEGWGWAPVDATPTENRGDNAPDWWENWSDLLGATLDTARRWVQSHVRLLFVCALALVPVVLLLAARAGMADPLTARLNASTQGRIKLSGNQSRRLVFKAYGRAARQLARRFRRRTDWETPHEWIQAAEKALALEDPIPLRDLTRLYTRAQYSPLAIDAGDGAAAYQALKNLSWKTKKL